MVVYATIRDQVCIVVVSIFGVQEIHHTLLHGSLIGRDTALVISCVKIHNETRKAARRPRDDRLRACTCHHENDKKNTSLLLQLSVQLEMDSILCSEDRWWPAKPFHVRAFHDIITTTHSDSVSHHNQYFQWNFHDLLLTRIKYSYNILLDQSIRLTFSSDTINIKLSWGKMFKFCSSLPKIKCGSILRVSVAKNPLHVIRHIYSYSLCFTKRVCNDHISSSTGHLKTHNISLESLW